MEKEVKELSVFSLVRRIFARLHKYLHWEKIGGNKRLFNLAEKGRTRNDCLKLNSDQLQSEIKPRPLTEWGGEITAERGSEVQEVNL